MTDVDFEAIEAAVTETVRGRWFLNEFARRTRSAESRATLEAIGRLETLITAGQAALPPASNDPSVRLLIQRIKEIAAQIDGVSQEMRERGIDDDLCEALDLQARAVAGLMRSGLSARANTAPQPALSIKRPLEPEPAPEKHTIPKSVGVAIPEDPRLVVLSRLDGLPLAKKLALFA